MTDSFNIHPDTTADTLLDRIKQLELTVSANGHQQDAMHDRLIALERNNESLAAYIQRLETDSASTSRVKRIADDLADLRRDFTLALANGREETRQVNDRLDRHESLIADLIERTDRLTDFVNGKTIHTPEWPNVKPEQTTVAPPYASTSRVDRLNEELAELAVRLTRLDDLFDDRVQALLTTTPDLGLRFESLRHRVIFLEQKVEQLEDASDWHDGANMENGHAPNIPANDPKPPVDTSWHPYDVLVDDMPASAKRVVVMLRGNDEIAAPAQAGDWCWVECGDSTIVAWRYAKEGE